MTKENLKEAGQPQANEGGAHDDADDVMVPKTELTSVIAQRQQEKSKRRDAERSAAELQAQLAQYEAKEREREEDAMRKRGEFEKLLQAEKASKAEVAAQLKTVLWDQRFKNTVSAVSAKAGIAPSLVEGLLLREKHVGGADVAPEDLTDEMVTVLAKSLRSAAPSLFETQGQGGSPNTPGLNMGNKKPGEETMDAEKARIVALAKAHSHKRG